MANERNVYSAGDQSTTVSSGGSSKVDRFVSKLGDILYTRKMRRPEPAAVIEAPRISLSLHSLSDQLDFLNSNSSFDDAEERRACLSLARCIEAALRDAKTQYLECGEVLVPNDLTMRVAQDVVRLSEDEPCGLRGCLLFLNYEDGKANCRRIGKIKYDPDSVPTFELVLTLKHDASSWLGLRLLALRSCWKKFRTATIVVSPGYTLAKNKLYRSDHQ